MNAENYLDRLLAEYSGTFDIYKDYTIGGQTFAAYGFFFSDQEKFVVSQKANLWSVHSYEHVLFVKTEQADLQLIGNLKRIIKEHMEPELVCHGNKYPEKDHMYSFLTAIILSEKAPPAEVIEAVQKYKYERSFLFTIRGTTQGHMVLVDLENERVYTNKVSRKLKPVYEKIFQHVREGKPGYEEMINGNADFVRKV